MRKHQDLSYIIWHKMMSSSIQVLSPAPTTMFATTSLPQNWIAITHLAE